MAESSCVDHDDLQPAESIPHERLLPNDSRFAKCGTYGRKPFSRFRMYDLHEISVSQWPKGMYMRWMHYKDGGVWTEKVVG